MSKLVLAILVSICLVSEGWCVVTVTAETNRTEVRVGDRLQVTVRATRPDSLNEAVPAHAGLQLGPEWETGAQTAESERADSAGLVKTWHFELRALAETTATITPIVLLGGAPVDGPPLATNRVLGPTLTVKISKARELPAWVPHPRTLAVVFGLAVAVFTALRAWRRRRQNAPRTPKTPLQEAMAMMAEVHTNCRIDRASRFFADVERVISGYLSRRTGRPLVSATAAEMACLAARQVRDPEVLADLQTILQRCTTARFSGAKPDFQLLAHTEELALNTLERLDAVWVTDTPSGGQAVQGQDGT